jgi:hypothetical protein
VPTPPSESESIPSQDHVPVLSASENPKHFVPEISRTLGPRAWKQVVKDWDEQDLTRSHHVSLKDWDPAWHRSTGESVKYGQRRRIALEFIER